MQSISTQVDQFVSISISREIQSNIKDKIGRLTIIIPAFNEEKTILAILNKINEVKLIRHIEKEVIVVDDCSIDQTADFVTSFSKKKPELFIKYIRHSSNKGKGSSIHTGIELATGDLVIIQDADLEYDPNDFNKLLRPIIAGHADVVYGSRFMGGNAHRILFFWHSIGNQLLTFLSNIFSDLNLTDMETGYKIFKTNILRSIALKEKRFGFEPEITAKIARVPGIRIYEVGISYYGRTYKEGKKIKLRDAVRTLFCILKYSFLVSKRQYFKQPTSSGVSKHISQDI
jgi:glycosyltransferase involved in cell wall biosynthesis